MDIDEPKDLRLEFRIKNNVLYRAIAQQYGSVAALCRAYKHWLPSPSSIYQLLSFKCSPRDQLGEFRESCQRISDVLGVAPEDLFPQRLYQAIQQSFKVLEVRSFTALPSTVARELKALPAPAQEPVNVLGGQEEREQLAAALSTLPDLERQALELRYGMGQQSTTHSLREIADIQKTNCENVRQRCLKATDHLRKVLVEKKILVPYPTRSRARITCRAGHPTTVGLRPNFTRVEAVSLGCIRRQMPTPLRYGYKPEFSPVQARKLLVAKEILTRLGGFPNELNAVAIRYGLHCEIAHTFVELGQALGCDGLKSVALVKSGLSRLMGTLVLSPLDLPPCVLCQQGKQSEITLLKSEESLICNIRHALAATGLNAPEQLPGIMRSALEKVIAAKVGKASQHLPTPRQLETLTLRFGLNCGQVHGYEDVSTALQISIKGNTAQLVRDAMKAMLSILE